MHSILLSLLVFALDQDAASVLKQADLYRSPDSGFEIEVEVIEEGSTPNEFKVFIEGNDRSLMTTEAPPRDRGRNLLMIDRDMWIFIPKINRPVRVSLQQKLVGQVANGDLSRLRWRGDYTAEFAPEKNRVIKGAKAKCLKLSAAKKGLTYDQILLWVESASNRPLLAEYLTPSGKLLKSSTFEDYGELGGAIRPRKMKIVDALNQNEVSIIVIKKMKTREFSKGFFTQTNLSRNRF